MKKIWEAGNCDLTPASRKQMFFASLQKSKEMFSLYMLDGEVLAGRGAGTVSPQSPIHGNPALHS